MREQLEKICEASKQREDFFIKQWEMMPLPCLQRESNSFVSMNERLIRGESNTNMPFPGNGFEGAQECANLQPQLKPQFQSFPGQAANSFSISLPGK